MYNVCYNFRGVGMTRNILVEIRFVSRIRELLF
jgi:hypothetical protein